METKIKKILWRAKHRGSRELDILLGNWVENHIYTMDSNTLDELEVFMTLPEPDIYDILAGHRPFPEQFKKLKDFPC